MAITKLERTQIEKVFIAFLNAAPSITYLDQFVGYAGRVNVLASDLAQTDAFKAIYPSFLTNEEFAAKFVANFVGSTASDVAKAYVADEVVKSLNAGISRGDTLFNVVVALQAVPDGDATFGNTKKAFENKVAVADYYAVTKLGDATDLATLQNLIANVTPTTDVSSTAALDAIVGGPAAGANFTLTTGQDTLVGTSANNTFFSNVVQNVNGQQVNTLGSGDVLNGGSGVDTLSAKVTAGAFVNGGQTMPIQPETASIENIKLQAVNSGIGETTEVYVNAKDITGLTKIASNHSDANLTIQNLTTLGDNGLARPVSSLTVGMEYTGNADSRWDESDLHVYFDQDYLTTQTTFTSPSIDFKLMNEDAYDATINTAGGVKPLAGVVVQQMDIHLNGKTYSLAPYLAAAEPVTGTGNEISTYAEQLVAIQAAIVKLKADNPTDLALQSLAAVNGVSFTSDISPRTGQLRSGTTVTLTVDGATDGQQNVLTVSATDLQLVRAPQATLPNNNRYERAEQTPAVAGKILEINVDLEKVGLAGAGGDLVIGSMNKTAANTWNGVSTVTETVSGINQFNVTVRGANDKSSSLASLASTNNNLKVVNVVTDANQVGSFADLTIGNSNTDGVLGAAPRADNANALKDVQTFDASGLKGDLTLFAGLTSEVTAKYLNVRDDAANAAADNVAFTYTGGAGDDYINLALASSNLAQPGTVTREDLTLTVSGGAGDDEIATEVVLQQNSNWYANQHINANLKVGAGNAVATGQLQLNGNDGNDTIRNFGSGDFAINGGAGNDTVYSDNTGGHATWVFNSTNTNLGDLISEAAVAPITNIVNLNLTVSFKGFQKTVAVGGATAGSSAGVSITDLSINQAIKDAINNDAVLSKLLAAEDGPARTLVVRDLIDGGQASGDVAVSLSSTALTAGQSLLTNLHLLNAVEAAALGFGEVTATGYDATGRFDSSLVTSDTSSNSAFTPSSASSATSDSLIVGGAGNDVIVLSTGANSNEGVGYAGFANGTDTIVNFVDGDIVGRAWNGGREEVVQLAFGNSDGSPGAQTITFDGVTVTLAAAGQGVIPALDVATQFVNQYNAAAASNHWEAVHLGGGGVGLINDVYGAKTDLVSGDFTGTYFTGGGGTVAPVVVVQQGLDVVAGGSASTFTVTFNTATTAVAAGGATINFAGAAIALNQGAGALTVAEAVEAGVYTGWNAGPVVTNGNGASYSVTFTATAIGATALPTDATFLVDSASTGDGILGTLTGNVGVAATTTVPVLTPSYDLGIDHLDFSSYDAVAVYVGGALVAGAAPTAVGQSYITLVEGTGAAVGTYTISEMAEAGALGAAGDTVVGVIGVADFGATQTFVAQNFVL